MIIYIHNFGLAIIMRLVIVLLWIICNASDVIYIDREIRNVDIDDIIFDDIVMLVYYIDSLFRFYCRSHKPIFYYLTYYYYSFL